MIDFRKIIPISSSIVVLVALLITAILLIVFSTNPTYVIQVSLVPDYLDINRIELKRDQNVVIYKNRGEIFYDITGSVKNSVFSSVLVSLHPKNQEEFNSPKSFRVSNGTFGGTVKLVSSDSSATSDGSFAYKIESGDDKSLLSRGIIQFQIKGIISGTSPLGMLIIGGIGLFASLLQIIQIRTKRG